MTDNTYGAMTTTNDLPRVTFERVIGAAIDVVWAMLTTDDGLERWLAPAKVDLRVGGSVDIDFGENGMVGGEIIDVVPGISLEYHWRFTGEPDSVIRFELEVVDATSTKLRLDHQLLPIDQAVGYGSGWHAHLDQLETILVYNQPINWAERFMELIPEYESMTA